MMDPIGRKKGKGISSEDRRKVSDSLRNAKLPEVKKSKPDVHSEATNATRRNSGGTAGGETQNGGKRFQIITIIGGMDNLHQYLCRDFEQNLSKQEKGQPFEMSKLRW